MSLNYSDLDDDEFDEGESELIDYDEVSDFAYQGLKNPKMIAHMMELPVKWFTSTHKEKIDLAIERGLARLALDTTNQIRRAAFLGDFQAQKYIIQNIDDEWTDRKEVVNKNEIDILGLPTLREMWNKGIEDKTKEKVINSIEGEFTEE